MKLLEAVAKKYPKQWEKLVFALGDLRLLRQYPFLTKDIHPLCGIEEAVGMLGVPKYGDVILHKGIGYLGNRAIPGWMKHAAFCTEDLRSFTEFLHKDPNYITQPIMEHPASVQVVEAVSEGVLHRSALHSILYDEVLVMRPIGLTDEEIKGACIKAKRTVGSKYDTLFDFNIDEQLSYYAAYDNNDKDFLEKCKMGVVQAPRFSCTEVVAFSYSHVAARLGIDRVMHMGKEIIPADMFTGKQWKIAFASESTRKYLPTVTEDGNKVYSDVANKMGISRELQDKLYDYLVIQLGHPYVKS